MESLCDGAVQNRMGPDSIPRPREVEAHTSVARRILFITSGWAIIWASGAAMTLITPDMVPKRGKNGLEILARNFKMYATNRISSKSIQSTSYENTRIRGLTRIALAKNSKKFVPEKSPIYSGFRVIDVRVFETHLYKQICNRVNVSPRVLL